MQEITYETFLLYKLEKMEFGPQLIVEIKIAYNY